jgi:hypothetical protein
MIKLAELLDENRYPEYSNDALVDMIINLSRFEGNEELIASIKDELKRRKKTIPEATFTSKYDDSPKLKGKQTELPDELQANIVDENHLNWPPTQDHESTMAKGELRDMIKSGMKIYNIIKPNQQLPGWVSAYITLASDYMDSVADYLIEEETTMNQEYNNG